MLPSSNTLESLLHESRDLLVGIQAEQGSQTEGPLNTDFQSSTESVSSVKSLFYRRVFELVPITRLARTGVALNQRVANLESRDLQISAGDFHSSFLKAID